MQRAQSLHLSFMLLPRTTAFWLGILQNCRDSSLLAQALESSNQPRVLLETSLRKFSAATLAQYLRAVRIFPAFVSQCAGSFSLLSLAHLSDFLAGCPTSVQEDRSTLRCSPLLMCKALFGKASQHLRNAGVGTVRGQLENGRKSLKSYKAFWIRKFLIIG